QSGVSGGSMFLLSEIIDCAPSSKGCKRQALFGPAGGSNNASSVDDDDPASPSVASVNVAGVASGVSVSTNNSIATAEPGSAFLLALGLAGLTPFLLRRKEPALTNITGH